jgi:hypothetical protein
MKRMILFIARRFQKRKTFKTLFSEAVSEGIRDTMLEMGYRFEDPKKDIHKASTCYLQFFLN